MKPIFLHHRPTNKCAVKNIVSFLVFFTGIAVFSFSNLSAQILLEQTAPLKYRIVLKDKLHSTFSADNPEDFLSPRALTRREKQNIPITFNDLPVSTIYIDSIKATGANVLTVSKWFNAITIETMDSAILRKIAGFSFVVPYNETPSRFLHVSNSASGKSGIQEIQQKTLPDYGPSWLQIAIHNGQLLHENGFTGSNILIAVIDAGFLKADVLMAFDYLRDNGKIIHSRDFVSPGNDVYTESSHGMSVLSIIAGNSDGQLIGTAPDASFLLLRSEDIYSEYIIEEDNWIAAAEYADSAGADIINTSLGYSEFYESSQNHSYADMNGNTTRISRAADIAASKGILVVVSAGNEGNSDWRYISAPADADSVLTVGAINSSQIVTAFSSRGPSSDKEVKPTVVALGQGTYVAGLDNKVKQGNGTSFSAPVITGLAACLWQANPDASAMEIYNAICQSADRYYQPDYNYGYGVPDFNLANILLRASENEDQESGGSTLFFPNPFSDRIYVFFGSPANEDVDIRIFDLAGKELFHNIYTQMEGRKFLIIDSDFVSLQKGVYIISIDTGNGASNSKMVKF